MRAVQHVVAKMMKTPALVVSGALALTGCSPNTSGDTSQTCAALTVTEATTTPKWTGTVFTIVMENHSYGDIIGNPDAPYINQLATQNAIARGYHDAYVHPSEPNYLFMAAGENFGILDDDDPISHPIDATSHIADQLELADLTWKSYQESMGAPCGLTSQGRYAAKHNPFVFFEDINGWDGKQFQPSTRCNEHVVDYSQLDVDIAANALPRYVFITPNLDDDMHDGTIQQGDTWLSNEMPKLLATNNYKNGGVIFLLWDEGGGLVPSDDPPFIAISPNVKVGEMSMSNYDERSYLKTVETIFGLDALPCNKSTAPVQAMSDLFVMPLTSAAANTMSPTPTVPSASTPTASSGT
jgi:phosphatidylinositol-3-phosphatase